MRFPYLFLLLCATAFGQSVNQSPSENLLTTGPAVPALQPSQLKAAGSIQCLAPVETAVQTGEATLPCTNWFKLDKSAAVRIPFAPPTTSVPRLMAQMDPKIVVHPLQSAIGDLPPGKPVLPKIYPRLKMQLIHRGNPTANPLAP